MANRGHIFQARRQHLLQLLLGADVGGVPTGLQIYKLVREVFPTLKIRNLLAAVGGTGVQPGVALPAITNI